VLMSKKKPRNKPSGGTEQMKNYVRRKDIISIEKKKHTGREEKRRTFCKTIQVWRARLLAQPSGKIWPCEMNEGTRAKLQNRGKRSSSEGKRDTRHLN